MANQFKISRTIKATDEFMKQFETNYPEVNQLRYRRAAARICRRLRNGELDTMEGMVMLSLADGYRDAAAEVSKAYRKKGYDKKQSWLVSLMKLKAKKKPIDAKHQ